MYTEVYNQNTVWWWCELKVYKECKNDFWLTVQLQCLGNITEMHIYDDMWNADNFLGTVYFVFNSHNAFLCFKKIRGSGKGEQLYDKPLSRHVVLP